jgi:hypothetical protein
LGSWVSSQVQTAQSFYNNNLPWAVAGTLNSALSIVGGVGQIPQALGNVGTGSGTFSADPTLANSAGVFSDISVVASVAIPVAGIADGALATGATAGTSGAENALNGVRLNQQLSAQSAFNPSGGLSQEAISGSSQIFAPGELGNPAIPQGFGKFTTPSFNSPSGPFQVHFYQNPTTGEIWTGLDYKVVFNTPF